MSKLTNNNRLLKLNKAEGTTEKEAKNLSKKKYHKKQSLNYNPKI